MKKVMIINVKAIKSLCHSRPVVMMDKYDRVMEMTDNHRHIDIGYTSQGGTGQYTKPYTFL